MHDAGQLRTASAPAGCGSEVWPEAAARLPLPWIVLAGDGRIVQASAVVAAWISPGREVASDAGWWAALAPESAAALRQAVTQGDECHLTLQIDAPGCPRRWVACHGRRPSPHAEWLMLLSDVTADRERERAIVDEADRFRLLADNVPVSIAYYERAGYTCRFANRLYAQSFGLDERSVIGKTVAEVIGAEAARLIQPAIDQVLAERRIAVYERETRGSDGRPRLIEVHLLPHVAHDGDETVGVFVLITDITRHREAERELRQSQERLTKFMQASVEGIVFHKDGLITDVNPPLLEMLGYTLDEMMGRPTLDFVAPDQRARVREVIVAGHEITYESVVLHKHGLRIPVEFIVRTMMYGDERLRMTIVRDLRDRQAALARIHHLAHHDALTGLPNRGAFLEQTEIALAQARRVGAAAALLFVDIDHFKRVNDSLGHLAGDALLRIVAQRLTAALRDTDLVARYAGDEFVVLLAGDPQRADIEEVARKLLAAVEDPTEIDGPSITVTPSIGIAIFPHDSVDAAELIKHADTAMYHAKSGGRAQYRFFEPVMARAAYDALVLESDLATAIRARQFELHFQPQVHVAKGTPVGVEGLLRWRHPLRGLVSPNDFVPLAEQRRMMLDIGRWVLDEALAAAGRWRAQGLGDLPVGVNLSSMQFTMSGFVELVEEALARHGVDGRALELELTERMLMEDLPTVCATLRRLRAHGIRIAVDDFGTGYTSLGHLKELPIDRLKIDKSFVDGLPGDRGAAAVADAIVRMARGLGLGVIAEGVERVDQLHWLATHGCEEIQGHLVAMPMDGAGFDAWLRARAAATSLPPSAAGASSTG